MEKSYKFRIYPNKIQEDLIQKTFSHSRFVWNYYLARSIKSYEEEGKHFNLYESNYNLTELKKEMSWLREVDATALLASLRNLDAAYHNFFRGLKSSTKVGCPKFKKKLYYHKSYTCRGTAIRTIDNHIHLPKVGKTKCRVSKQIEGRVLSATVSQNSSGKYFVSITCTDVDIKPFESTGAIVGIDLGLKELCITSDGQHIKNNKYLSKSQDKLAKLQRSLSRKPKDSTNREKARIKLAKLYEKITNQRLDALNKITTSLVNDYDLVVIETLASKNLMRNHRLARAIEDAAWGEIGRQLEYKTIWHGKRLVKIGQFFPSSQICYMCGYKNIEVKNLAVREWNCPQCKHHNNRDENAAKNILEEGIRILNVA